MLDTDEQLLFTEYNFKSSPESSSGDSFLTDYENLPSDEDFLQQLSTELDIPSLFNQGEDGLSVLNSLLSGGGDDNLLSPLEHDLKETQKIGEELKELQKIDVTKCGIDAFPNLHAELEVKAELLSDESSSTDSESQQQSAACQKNVTLEMFTVDEKSLETKKRRDSKLIQKRTLIHPKTPYDRNNSKQQKVIVVAPSPTQNGGGGGGFNGAQNIVLVDDMVVPVTTAQIATINAPLITNPVVPVMVNKTEGANSVLDIRALKRQQRMIKNRESACLSRKKKKDYLTSLEKQVQDLTVENKQLKEENAALKEQLAAVCGKSLSVPVKNLANGIAICAVILMVAVNFNVVRSPYSLSSIPSNKPQTLPKLADHHGRNLLWSFEPDPQPNKTASNTTNTTDLKICPMNVNQTESVRLAQELHRWIGKPSNASAPYAKSAAAAPRTKANRLKTALSAATAFSSSSVFKMGRRNLRKYVEEISSGELQVYSPEQLYAEFFAAINRQDDTFYVVSLSADHLLLPALHHNKTRRPKMSLIMPAVLLPNDSAASHSAQLVSLMQIDCEVLDTRLIHVKHGVIPQSFNFKSEGGNSSSTVKEPPKKRRQSKSEGGGYKGRGYTPYFMQANETGRGESEKLIP